MSKKFIGKVFNSIDETCINIFSKCSYLLIFLYTSTTSSFLFNAPQLHPRLLLPPGLVSPTLESTGLDPYTRKAKPQHSKE